MQRNLILGERIMYADAQAPVNCVFTTTIRGRISQANLNTALARLQESHPLLKASIRRNAYGRPYFFADGQAPGIPIRKVQWKSDYDWIAISEEEWSIPFDVDNGPLARVVWIRDTNASQLMLVCPHCICDGVTIVTLMRELLALIDCPHRELPANSVFHSIRQIVPCSAPVNKVKILKSAIHSFVTYLGLSFKKNRVGTTKGKDYLVHWKLNPKATSLLVSRCKEEGISVYSALCVSFLEAFRQVRKEKACNQVICPVDIRRLVPEIKDDMMFAFAPIIKLSIRKDSSPGFWEKARRLKEDINAGIESLNAYEQLLAGEYYHASVKKIVDFLMTEDSGHDFTFSNMGRLNISTEYNSFQIDTIFSATVAFPWKNPTTLVVSTFRGQMDFAFISNTHFLSYEEAISIKGKGLALILEELIKEKAF